jgi:hypothetical protein
VEVDGEEAHGRIIAPSLQVTSVVVDDGPMRRMRWMAVLLVMVLGLGLAACGGDDGGDDDGGSADSGDSSGDSESSDEDSSDTTEAPDDTASEDDGDTELSEGVDGYCEAVERYIELLGEAIDDPASAGAELQEATNDYATAAINLGELTPDEQLQFENCQEAASQAAAELVPGG